MSSPGWGDIVVLAGRARLEQCWWCVLLHGGKGLLSLEKVGFYPLGGTIGVEIPVQDWAAFSASSPHEKEVTALLWLLRNGAVSESRAAVVPCACHQKEQPCLPSNHTKVTLFVGQLCFLGCSEAAECHRQCFPCAEKSRALSLQGQFGILLSAK